MWARHFRAAARLYRVAPWNVIPSDVWIAVDCEQLGISAGALTVVGQARESLGFMLLPHASRMRSPGSRPASGASAASEVELPLCYMFGFDHRDRDRSG